MYKLERKPFGVKITFSGHIRKAELEQWLEESRPILDKIDGAFHVFVDMREMTLLPPESQPALKEGQALYRSRGMVRSVIILNDDIIAMQFKRIARQTGIYKWERYIDSSAEDNWEQVGLDWLLDAVDPDLVRKAQEVPVSR